MSLWQTVGRVTKARWQNLKCPSCGQAVNVPASEISPVEDSVDGLSKTTLVAMWSFAGVFGGIVKC